MDRDRFGSGQLHERFRNMEKSKLEKKEAEEKVLFYIALRKIKNENVKGVITFLIYHGIFTMNILC